MSKHILNFNQWMELKENRNIQGNLLNENQNLEDYQIWDNAVFNFLGRCLLLSENGLLVGKDRYYPMEGIFKKAGSENLKDYLPNTPEGKNNIKKLESDPTFKVYWNILQSCIADKSFKKLENYYVPDGGVGSGDARQESIKKAKENVKNLAKKLNVNHDDVFDQADVVEFMFGDFKEIRDAKKDFMAYLGGQINVVPKDMSKPWTHDNIDTQYFEDRKINQNSVAEIFTKKGKKLK